MVEIAIVTYLKRLLRKPSTQPDELIGVSAILLIASIQILAYCNYLVQSLPFFHSRLRKKGFPHLCEKLGFGIF